MPAVRSYRDLKVWQHAMDLTVVVYELTRSFPRDEQYGLTSQVRRSVVSVAANIAEGYGRSTKPAYLNFLRIAQGSLKETETHLILASRLSNCDEAVVTELLSQTDERGRMLRGLIVSLEAHTSH
ncbi:four helix bundle protein [Brevundimonas subvibrioides]|uniref:Four helix bundle protein n=1 Tax=Brevundimonas subvibrioides (strain ATCC 15264 / DSM 4735 / LMG 14903 / NBRC 16000 / CB 81) TaxID=633149 RepID=D9QKX5_BRESC|nr:four helix bundle protein [Brevundimonas subvibrioides]ADL01789.1 conserved hypothetical protein [Brevundimonas subvibrioides ATCC 15264]